MNIKTLIKMGMDEAIDWLIENESNYELIKNNKCKFSYGFNGHVVHYNTAYELGVKCAELGSTSDFGGNPYDPDNTDYAAFVLGVNTTREKQASIKKQR